MGYHLLIVDVVLIISSHVHVAITIQASSKRLMNASVPSVRGRPSMLKIFTVRGELGTARSCSGAVRTKGFLSGNDCQLGDSCKRFTTEIRQAAYISIHHVLI
jgi:hypothetical protein